MQKPILTPNGPVSAVVDLVLEVGVQRSALLRELKAALIAAMMVGR
jgi:hypothetical protein